MSRSYKHTPYCGDTKHKEDKRRANKAFRKADYNDEVQPSMHRKMTESWNICDYHSRYTFDEWMNMTHGTFSSTIRNMSDEEREENWHKWYRRK